MGGRAARESQFNIFGGPQSFRKLLYGGCAVILFSFGFSAHAATSVVINEIMWDGVEYIELYNSTAEPVSLENWTLNRQQAGGNAKTITTFSAGDAIAANSYFLIEKNESATTATANKIVSSLVLVNTGELVTLNNNSGTLVDSANQLGEWFAGENTTDGSAMERTSNDLLGTELTSWHTAAQERSGRIGSPGEANSVPPENNAPEATISAATEGDVGESIIVSAEDSTDEDNDELSYTWNFGDGNSGTGSETTHIYQTSGTYTISLVVSDGEAESETTHTITITAPSYSDDISISEVLPNPTGDDAAGEFIELHNTGSTTVSLTNWQLDDVEGGSPPHTVAAGLTIAAGEYKIFSRTTTKITLNNEADSVRLLDPNGELKSTFSYTKTVPEGQSYSFAEASNSYELTTTPTAGTKNTITAPTTDEDEDEEDSNDESSTTKTGKVAGTIATSLPLAEVREAEKGTIIQTEGTVSVPPGILNTKRMYLAGSGIQLYMSSGAFPALKLGDFVRVTGKLSSSQEESRLTISNTSDIIKTKEGPPPAPHQVATGDIDEEWEGSLVILQGQVTQTSGNTFYVDDDSGEIKVFISEGTKIDKPKMKKGTDVTITGVVSQTTSGYRVLPRFQEDIRLGLVAGLTSFPATGTKNYLLIGLIIAAIVLIYSAHQNHEPLLGAL